MNRRQLNSSRKGRPDSHAKVQTVQAGRGSGGWSWLDPSAGLEYGRCAQPPRYGISYPISTKSLISKRKLRDPYIPTLHRYHVRVSTTSKFLHSISLYPDIVLRYRTRYRIKTSISYQYRVYTERQSWILYPTPKVFIRYRCNIGCTKSVFS